MSPLRRFLILAGLVLLLASLALLIVANLPSERLHEQQPIPAEDLTLPTPQAVTPPVHLAAAVSLPVPSLDLAT